MQDKKSHSQQDSRHPRSYLSIYLHLKSLVNLSSLLFALVEAGCLSREETSRLSRKLVRSIVGRPVCAVLAREVFHSVVHLCSKERRAMAV